MLVCYFSFNLFLITDDDFDEIHYSFSLHVLRVILEWCKYHLACSPEEDNQRVGDRSEWTLCQWDRHFFNKHKPGIFKIMNAAESLGIEKLQDACAMAIADRMKGKSVDRLKQEFRL